MLFVKPSIVDKFCDLPDGDAGIEKSVAINRKFSSILAGELGWRNTNPLTEVNTSNNLENRLQFLKFNPCCDCESVVVMVRAGYPELPTNECDDIVLDVPIELRDAVTMALCAELGQCKPSNGFGDNRTTAEKFLNDCWLAVREHSLKKILPFVQNTLDLRLPNVQEVRIFELDPDEETYFEDDSFLDFTDNECVIFESEWDEETNEALNENTGFFIREDGVLCGVCFCEPCCT